ncbi:Formylglycine-generating sulfatase enzyme [compost metagenome]
MKDILVMEGSAKMHPVDPGQKIEKKFWMSTTPITQRQWAIVSALFPGDMHENPSVHTNNKNSKVVELPDGKELEMQPENPVEYVTAVKDKEDRDYYSSAYNFIEKLNILSQRNDPAIYQLISGHQKGMIYDLPSEAQYEHVATNYGTNKGPTAARVFAYAHIKSNYGTGTMPVASLKAFDVAGGQFYDLLGNVGTLTSTATPKGNEVIVKGGSYGSDNKITFSSRSRVEPSSASEQVGFRIVGTLP